MFVAFLEPKRSSSQSAFNPNLAALAGANDFARPTALYRSSAACSEARHDAMQSIGYQIGLAGVPDRLGVKAGDHAATYDSNTDTHVLVDSAEVYSQVLSKRSNARFCLSLGAVL